MWKLVRKFFFCNSIKAPFHLTFLTLSFCTWCPTITHVGSIENTRSETAADQRKASPSVLFILPLNVLPFTYPHHMISTHIPGEYWILLVFSYIRWCYFSLIQILLYIWWKFWRMLAGCGKAYVRVRQTMRFSRVFSAFSPSALCIQCRVYRKRHGEANASRLMNRE